VPRRTPSSTPDLSNQSIQFRGFHAFSSIANPFGTVSDQFYLPTIPTHEPMELETNHASRISSSRQQPRGQTTRDQLQNLPLPQYHPDLPHIDRMKRSKAFYTDLQDKFIIAGFDDERFSCWCHVEKGKKGQAEPQSLNHTRIKKGKTQRYYSSYWFTHAQHCKFYKVRRIGLTLRVA
jgi:hypothetical protein